MHQWVDALIAAIFAGVVVIVVVLVLIRRCLASKQTVAVTEGHDPHQQEVSRTTEKKFTPSHTDVFGSQNRASYHLFHRGSSTKTFFNWADHPTLITEAVENGWSRFAFVSSATSSPSVIRSTLFASLSVRTAGEYYNNGSRDCVSSINNNTQAVEDSWEIGAGSVEFLQKISFKLKDLNSFISTSSAKATTRMALPLPGPPVADSFPQEAYFEITVVSSSEDNGTLKGLEEENTKLLFQRNFSSSAAYGGNLRNQEGLFQVSSSRGSHLLEELKSGGGGKRGGGGGVKMSIGMTVGGFVTNKMPGSYPGSIGFNSDGSVFLGGMKLVFESEKEDWAKTGKVIGCGFDPRKKKVYFTVDSELVHVIHCKSEDFGMPLYPALATNVDITLVVNLGQSSFNYLPSNACRTSNPCFIGRRKFICSSLGP